MRVYQMFRRPLVHGDVGVEIEVEGKRLPQIGEHWNVERDGSLRGESFEYVFNRPKTLPEAREALGMLDHAFTENRSEVYDTGRAGVHVHVNCGGMTRLHLYNFITLYLCVENLMVRWCGESRVGNRFCLRGCDAEWLVDQLTYCAQNGEERHMFRNDDLRYASMNLMALTTYGSLEFRAMRSTRDMDAIYRWASSLVGLREHAKTFADPQQIVLEMSAGGMDAFLHNYLPSMAEELMVGDWQQELWRGVRLAQDLAYCTDWANMEEPPRVIGGLPVSEDFDCDFPPIDF